MGFLDLEAAVIAMQLTKNSLSTHGEPREIGALLLISNGFPRYRYADSRYLIACVLKIYFCDFKIIIFCTPKPAH